MTKRWLVASLLIVGCGDDPSGPSTGGDTVGDEGGTIELDNGVTVEIPAGALGEDTEIEVTFVEDLADLDVADLPEGAEGMIGGALVLEPHGTVFDEPVTISIPTGLLAEDTVLWHLADEDAEEWDSDGAISIEDGALSFDVLSFSIYTPQTLAAGACPCWNGADMDTWAAAGNATFSAQPFAGHQFAMASRGNDRLRTMGLFVGSSTFSSYLCKRQGNTLPAIDINTTAAQHRACNALLKSKFQQRRVGNLQVGAYALGLATGETVGLQVGSESLTLLAGEELAFAEAVFARGDTVNASVTSSPSGKSCTVASPLTLGTVNAAFVVNCAAPTPCDDDLAGPWLSDESQPATYDVTGTKAAFAFDVPGGDVMGSVATNGVITANLDTDQVYAATSSTYACTTSGPETMHFEFPIKDGIMITLTKQ